MHYMVPVQLQNEKVQFTFVIPNLIRSDILHVFLLNSVHFKIKEQNNRINVFIIDCCKLFSLNTISGRKNFKFNFFEDMLRAMSGSYELRQDKHRIFN